MKSDILEINHSEFGIEKFRISAPRYNLYESEDGVWEFIIHLTTSETIQRVQELEDVIDPSPSIEATAVLSKEEINLKEGTHIHQKQGYDYDRDENLSVLYYFSYNSIENLTIEVLKVVQDHIILNVTGETIVNGSNGNDPDAKIYMHETKFLLDQNLKRSFF